MSNWKALTDVLANVEDMMGQGCFDLYFGTIDKFEKGEQRTWLYHDRKDAFRAKHLKHLIGFPVALEVLLQTEKGAIPCRRGTQSKVVLQN